MNRYHLRKLPPWQYYDASDDSPRSEGEAPCWSGKAPPPAIGSRVDTVYGKAAVTGYFVEHGWIGVHVRLDAPPDWMRLPRSGICCMFGCDLR